MKKSGASQGQSASELISKRIAELGDWRGKTLSRMRKLIKEADPDVVEEWKWMGTPVWSHDGIICTGESYKNVVKLTFAKGASLKDPARLFNSSLDGNVRRAIDIHEGEEVDESAFKALVRQAVALNVLARRNLRRKRSPEEFRPRVPGRFRGYPASMAGVEVAAVLARRTPEEDPHRQLPVPREHPRAAGIGGAGDGGVRGELQKPTALHRDDVVAADEPFHVLDELFDDHPVILAGRAGQRLTAAMRGLPPAREERFHT